MSFTLLNEMDQCQEVGPTLPSCKHYEQMSTVWVACACGSVTRIQRVCCLFGH